jgi:hypothetical protein
MKQTAVPFSWAYCPDCKNPFRQYRPNWPFCFSCWLKGHPTPAKSPVRERKEVVFRPATHLEVLLSRTSGSQGTTPARDVHTIRNSALL